MSNKDYTKYAKANETVVEKVEETPVEPAFVPNVAFDAVVEPTVTTVAAAEPVIENEPESIPEPEVVETRKIGHVYNCAKLNVRVAPKSTADIVCEIHCNAEVEINEDESTGDFYKICTSSGIEGFCMKDYINAK